MTDIAEIIQTTHRKGGGRDHHLDQFLRHISDEHEAGLRRILADQSIGHAHVTRVIGELVRREYPEFVLGMKEGSVRKWRADHT